MQTLQPYFQFLHFYMRRSSFQCLAIKSALSISGHGVVKQQRRRARLSLTCCTRGAQIIPSGNTLMETLLLPRNLKMF
jgi:hypothetical protein